MRHSQKQAGIHHQAGLFDMNFHQFTEAEAGTDRIEVVSGLGVSRGEVKKLKKNLNRA